MMHSVEVMVYNLVAEDEYDETDLEVVFDFNPNGQYEITGYNMYDYTADMSHVKEHNPGIEKIIDNTINEYIVNYEPDYYEEY